MARIYVGTYHKYNCGSIAGKWMDCEDYADREAFLKACAELHSDEADPELMFQDWEDIPQGLVGESFVSDELWDWLALDKDDRELLAVYREHVNEDGDIEEAREAFRGRADTEADAAYNYWEESGLLDQVPEFARNYIDWDSVARDLGYEGWTFVRRVGEVWIFSN